MFEFGASHKRNWTSIKRFGSVEFSVPEPLRATESLFTRKE